MELTTILLAVIPTIGSITVAWFANQKSKKAELRALEIEAKAASREDFTAVISGQEQLFLMAQREIENLRARIVYLEGIIFNPDTPTT